MLRKKEAYTNITPIPGYIPRQLALDLLHSHSEVLTVNPLVLDHRAIPAPRNAAADEFYSTWYEIVERIQYVPGAGSIGAGKISFNGCFHDMPWGLQTHIYAPLNIDLRHRYRIAGNQPGAEAPEPREIGMEKLGVPGDGLYLREDIEIRCNIAMVGFVKAQLKAASKEMVSRIIKKAELLDAGVLQAMIQEGRLKTYNPNDRSMIPGAPAAASANSRATTPGMPNDPRTSYLGRSDTGASYQQGWSRRDSKSPQYPPYQQQQHPSGSMSPTQPPYLRPGTGSSSSYSQPSPDPYRPAQPYQVPRSPQLSQGPQQTPHMHPAKDNVGSVELPADMRFASSPGFYPGHGPQAFAAELPAHSETAEEHQMNYRR